jgi:hypothetical protein
MIIDSTTFILKSYCFTHINYFQFPLHFIIEFIFLLSNYYFLRYMLILVFDFIINNQNNPIWKSFHFLHLIL